MKVKKDAIELENFIIKVFKDSYKKKNVMVLRRRLGRIMKKFDLVSNSTIK